MCLLDSYQTLYVLRPINELKNDSYFLRTLAMMHNFLKKVLFKANAMPTLLTYFYKEFRDDSSSFVHVFTKQDRTIYLSILKGDVN